LLAKNRGFSIASCIAFENVGHAVKPPEKTKAIDAPVQFERERSIERLMAPLQGRPNLIVDALPFESAGSNWTLPRVIFSGANSADPIRIGIFAAIHGDEPAGALALVRFFAELDPRAEFAEIYQIRGYPVCNPSGFASNTRVSAAGRDLNREFWKASSEPEVQLLERELRNEHFHGLIQLHADDTSDGIYGFVRGATLTENLLRPALIEAGKVLPRNVNAQIDGFAARDGMIYDIYDGVLAAPREMQPVPFEIILETPHNAPIDQQVEALVIAMRTILFEYRQLISFAQNI
jgi:murein peptide amidase A